MVEFDLEKVKAVYDALIANRDKAIAEALLRKDEEIAARIELLKPDLEAVVIKDLTEEAEAPFAHDIELFEKLLKEEPVAEQSVVEEQAPIQE